MKKLPPLCQEKIDLFHTLGFLSDRFRSFPGSDDLQKYFGKVYLHSRDTGIVRNPFLLLSPSNCDADRSSYLHE